MAVFKTNEWVRRFFIGCGVGGIAALNIAAFVGGRFNERLDLVAHAAPAMLIVGLAFSALAAACWGLRGGAVALILAVSPSALLVTMEAAGGSMLSSQPVAADIKILSLNIWSRNSSLGAVDALIQREQPDFIFLQEASTKRHRSLLRRLSATYPFQVSAPLHCSTRVLSRHQLIEAFAWPGCFMAGGRFRLPVALGGGEVSAISVHLPRPYLPGAALESAAAQRRIAELSGGSLIVAGDFNRTPWSWALRRFDEMPGILRCTRGMATWPSRVWRASDRWAPPWPVLPIDHVFASLDWRAASVRIAPEVGSDHEPVLVEFARALRRVDGR